MRTVFPFGAEMSIASPLIGPTSRMRIVSSPPDAGGGCVRHHGRTHLLVTYAPARATARRTAIAHPQPRLARRPNQKSSSGFLRSSGCDSPGGESTEFATRMTAGIAEKSPLAYASRASFAFTTSQIDSRETTCSSINTNRSPSFGFNLIAVLKVKLFVLYGASEKPSVRLTLICGLLSELMVISEYLSPIILSSVLFATDRRSR